MIRRICARVVFLAVVPLFLACGDGSGPGTIPEVTLSAGATSLELVPGGANFIVFSVQRSGGYSGTVDLGTTNVPQGITAVFDPPKISGTALVSSLRISVAPLTPPGTYTISARASGSGVESTSVPVTIVVTVPTITLSTGATALTLESAVVPIVRRPIKPAT